MAEFCLDCWNQINETNDPRYKYVMSFGKERCEGCGEYKKIIVTERLWWRILKKRQNKRRAE